MEGDLKTDNPKLRAAIFKVFNGRCFYTGQKVLEEEMVVDHVVPKSKGGFDSVYNYALTTKYLNSKKSNKLDEEGVEPILYLIKMVYAPKVLNLLKRADSLRRRMIRATVYVDETLWHKINISALKASEKTGKKVSIGSYLSMLYLNKQEATEKIIETSEPEKTESAISTGLDKKKDIISELKKDVSVVEDKFFNPQPKKEKK